MMKTRAVVSLAMWGLACAAVAVMAGDEDGTKADSGKKKVTLCHRPPGNPANAHTISVGEPARAAHLRHGDQLGACPDEDAITSGTPATPDAPAKGRRRKTPAAPPTKADTQPN
jgi:hypothetical protein